MFSENTFDFLMENRYMNSKEWFHEHKDTYDEYVLKPLTQLAESLGPVIETIDDKIVTTPKINKTISRIYRDTRFSKDKSLYRESAWLTFKRDKKAFLHYPEIFVAVSPTSFVYGCGYYCMEKNSMQTVRDMIVRDDPAYIKALESYDNQDVFTLCGDKFKRSKYPDYSDVKKDWLDRKNINFMNTSADFSLLFSDDLADKLSEDICLLKDMYLFFVKAESEARMK